MGEYEFRWLQYGDARVLQYRLLRAVHHVWTGEWRVVPTEVCSAEDWMKLVEESSDG